MGARPPHRLPSAAAGLPPPPRSVYFLRFSIWHTGDADGMNPLHVSHATGILVRGVAVRGIRTLPEANNNIETAPKNTRVGRLAQQ